MPRLLSRRRRRRVYTTKLIATLSILLFHLTLLCDAYEYEDACVHCPRYILASALYKETVIKGKTLGTLYQDKYKDDKDYLPDFKDVCEALDLAEGIDFNNAFDRFSDERPEIFQRFFHHYGALAFVKFEAAAAINHGFTGIFQGADYGVLRLSPLAPILQEKYLVNHFLGTFLYSFGIKFFRDGIHSGNMNVGDNVKSFRNYTSNRQFYDKPDFNMLARPQDNMPGIGDFLSPLFGEFEKFSGVLSPVDAATYDQYGQEASPIKAPVIVYFKPNPVFRDRFGFPPLDFRTWVTKDDAIHEGELLYEVWTTQYKASDEPSLCVDSRGFPQVDADVQKDCPDQELVHLGNVIAKSKFYAAEWPDQWLFFQHHRMCPKDQSVCGMDNDPDTPLPGLDLMGIPDTTYAVDNSDFCFSSNNKSGLVSGIPPSCPFGSVPLQRVDCYEGKPRNVESVQTKTCPMLDKVAQSILTTAEGADTSLPNCDFGYYALNTFLTVMLAGLSPALRCFTTALPFTKPAIDFLIGLLPFGP